MSESQNPWLWSNEYQDHYRLAADAYGRLSTLSTLFLKVELHFEHKARPDRKVSVKVDNKRYGIKQKGCRMATMLTGPSSTPRQAPIATGAQYQTPSPYIYTQLQSPQSSTFGFADSSYTYGPSSREGQAFAPPQSANGEGVGGPSNYTEDVFSNSTRIEGTNTSGDAECLDPSYQLVNDRDGFFKTGRVFSMLYIENAGATAPPGSAGISVVQYGEKAYAQIRRFIVVEPKKRQHWSKCICITTYGGRATTKKGIDPKEHTIIYSGIGPPQKMEGEKGLYKEPLRVELVDNSQKLDPRSRVDFGRTFNIQHNVKVKEVGVLAQQDMHKLLLYWKQHH